MHEAKQKVFFRADGNSIMGLGHLFRSLALSQMLKNEFRTFFFTKSTSAHIHQQIQKVCEGVELVHSEEEFINYLTGQEVLVLDGYHFDDACQKRVKAHVHKLVAVDDLAEMHFYADVVINHGGTSIREKYKKEPYTRLLTGFPYLMIRPEFLKAAREKRLVDKVDTAFICMGGADPFHITVKALQACINSDFIKKIFVVTSSAYSNREQLTALINNCQTKAIKHEENIEAERMVQLLKQSEIAICPASTVAMEACCVRTGLLTGTVADNQLPTHQQLLKAGCCISAGDFNAATSSDLQKQLSRLADVKTVNKIIQQQMEAIDGLSGERILAEFKTLAAC